MYVGHTWNSDAKCFAWRSWTDLMNMNFLLSYCTMGYSVILFILNKITQKVCKNQVKLTQLMFKPYLEFFCWVSKISWTSNVILEPSFHYYLPFVCCSDPSATIVSIAALLLHSKNFWAYHGRNIGQDNCKTMCIDHESCLTTEPAYDVLHCDLLSSVLSECCNNMVLK